MVHVSFFTISSMLFTAMLTHGVAHVGLLLSTLVPIPKNKRGDTCDSNNYRQIAISSLLGKLFDTIVLEEQHTSLSTDILQFGFKKNTSTVICTSLMKLLNITMTIILIAIYYSQKHLTV